MNPLIIRRGGSLTDVLMATPVIHALKHEHPLAPIFVETTHPEIFEGNSDVYQAGKSLMPTHCEQWTELDDGGGPTLDGYAAWAKVPLLDRQLRYFGSTLEDQARVSEMLAPVADRPIAVVDAGNAIQTMARDSQWIDIVDFLAANGRSVVVISEDFRLFTGRDLDLRGQLSLGQAAFALMMSCLYVGTPSFHLHLAQSQGTPVVGLIGSAKPEHVFTDGIAVGVQGEATVEQVKAAIEQVWKREEATEDQAKPASAV